MIFLLPASVGIPRRLPDRSRPGYINIILRNYLTRTHIQASSRSPNDYVAISLPTGQPEKVFIRDGDAREKYADIVKKLAITSG
jgi:hypothetical protein